MIDIDPVALTADLIRCPWLRWRPGLYLCLKLYWSGMGLPVRGSSAVALTTYCRWGVGGKALRTAIRMLCRLAIFRNGKVIGGDISGVLYGRGAVDMKSGVAAFAVTSD